MFDITRAQCICGIVYMTCTSIYVRRCACTLYNRGWKANFYKSLQIANLQILGLILLSQIRKFLRCASPQIANPQIFMINPQISSKFCTFLSKNSPSSRLFHRIFSYVQVWIREVYVIQYFARRKSMYLRTCGSLSPQITKKIGSAKNRKPAKCHICGRSPNLTNYLSSQIFGFAICGIIFADLPPLVTNMLMLTCHFQYSNLYLLEIPD
jgi:hypothetical protein